MIIQVVGAAELFRQPLEHIVQLFFEEAQIWFGISAEDRTPDVNIELTLTGEQELYAHARLTEKRSGKVYEASYLRRISYCQEDKEWRKQAKQVISHPLLDVLERYTGIEQPWGILTGIRPTKLLHRKVQRNVPREQAHRELREDFLIRQEKIDLMQQIVDRQLTMVPDLYHLRGEVSIYIGIPFCPTKCAYCTFPAYAISGKQGSVDSFLGGLHYEMREIGRWLKEHDMKITTIYFGGGTPTSITAEEMDRLYEEMYASFPHMDKVRELTVEAGRPDTITLEKLEVLKKWKIDRISINPQSYIEETLKAIGRHHTVQETIDKFRLAREAGMNNINMDLIIGLPGEGVTEFEHTLAETEKLMPESVTVHTLSFKRASEMTRNKEKYKVASREEIQEMMKRAEEWTKARGYVPYYLYRQKNILGNLENVGYAKPGQESLYNIMIMEEMQTIIGLGCGAASKWVHPMTGAISRFANPKEPKAYNENYKHYTEAKIKVLDDLFGIKTGV
ncbi:MULTISPECIES: coproporphyrinogen III oxidase [Aneurinibacillus]|uniref:Coproporphyrinogen III oxidase n=1 Tax=Aneurinibacillus thermoaerophilus TaxID=143495 RepID=A0A1G7YBC5_ANETH|nr:MULTISPECIES: coproporphyrinogen III oxidase [Aneurinibacillus]AMA72168.1 coproporphyrinogen dehydrogenase HemZ [Aneurinibacillus sp. XH2]MED0676454.1 coproporphyrinogen III oxidase [Aneurinibacillus thermoaerophilus]MED0678966.1 coproporphyrinogen III oxidase [Aneurinibacillus thermoaerophilus]MED0736503.1 coproporphyrinogen III oxidase [Aneurinibacillus thermoaerophilus]MED0756006.1 coproporphyrinogen III oxidase [Aneurinibacillus thermoaerophilus]